VEIIAIGAALALYARLRRPHRHLHRHTVRHWRGPRCERRHHLGRTAAERQNWREPLAPAHLHHAPRCRSHGTDQPERRGCCPAASGDPQSNPQRWCLPPTRARC
jgi:hypothetical protein